MTTPNSSTGNYGGDADKSNASKSKALKAASKITRPYTSYNLFFQLEREYILQAVHGHRPTNLTAGDSSNIFDPSDRTNYHGPHLPTRYADLILPYDWHIPGKTQRRKRSHRKSHGKIGFHELNERISKAWSGVDEETRRFCTRLSDAEGRKFKKIKRDDTKKTKTKRRIPKRVVKKVIQNSGDGGCKQDGSNDVMPFDWPSSPVPREDVTPIFAGRMSASPAPLGRRRLSREVSYRLDESQDAATPGSCTLRDFLTEVDMDDDEIMMMWDSIPVTKDVDKDDGSSGMCHACVEIPTLLAQEQPEEQELVVGTTAKLATALTTKEEGQEARDGRMSFIEEEYERTTGKLAAALTTKEEGQEAHQDGRMSFIEEEYERFKEIGKQFRTSGRRNSTTAVGTITGGVGGNVSIPGTLTQKGFMARGA